MKKGLQNLKVKLSFELKHRKKSNKAAFVQTDEDMNLDQIAILQEENVLLRQNNDDLKDEVDEKRREFGSLEDQYDLIKNLKDSASSLSDELEEANVFKCELCHQICSSSDDLKDHIRTIHEERLKVKHELLMELGRMQTKIAQQSTQLTSAIFAYQKKERIERKKCTCRTYCRISHGKHNFIKFQSEEFSKELKHILTQ